MAYPGGRRSEIGDLAEILRTSVAELPAMMVWIGRQRAYTCWVSGHVSQLLLCLM